MSRQQGGIRVKPLESMMSPTKPAQTTQEIVPAPSRASTERTPLEELDRLNIEDLLHEAPRPFSDHRPEFTQLAHAQQQEAARRSQFPSAQMQGYQPTSTSSRFMPNTMAAPLSTTAYTNSSASGKRLDLLAGYVAPGSVAVVVVGDTNGNSSIVAQPNVFIPPSSNTSQQGGLMLPASVSSSYSGYQGGPNTSVTSSAGGSNNYQGGMLVVSSTGVPVTSSYHNRNNAYSSPASGVTSNNNNYYQRGTVISSSEGLTAYNNNYQSRGNAHASGVSATSSVNSYPNRGSIAPMVSSIGNNSYQNTMVTARAAMPSNSVIYHSETNTIIMTSGVTCSGNRNHNGFSGPAPAALVVSSNRTSVDATQAVPNASVPGPRINQPTPYAVPPVNQSVGHHSMPSVVPTPARSAQYANLQLSQLLSTPSASNVPGNQVLSTGSSTPADSPISATGLDKLVRMYGGDPLQNPSGTINHSSSKTMPNRTPPAESNTVNTPPTTQSQPLAEIRQRFIDKNSRTYERSSKLREIRPQQKSIFEPEQRSLTRQELPDNVVDVDADAPCVIIDCSSLAKNDSNAPSSVSPPRVSPLQNSTPHRVSPSSTVVTSTTSSSTSLPNLSNGRESRFPGPRALPPSSTVGTNTTSFLLPNQSNGNESRFVSPPPSTVPPNSTVGRSVTNHSNMESRFPPSSRMPTNTARISPSLPNPSNGMESRNARNSFTNTSNSTVGTSTSSSSTLVPNQMNGMGPRFTGPNPSTNTVQPFNTPAKSTQPENSLLSLPAYGVYDNKGNRIQNPIQSSYPQRGFEPTATNPPVRKTKPVPKTVPLPPPDNPMMKYNNNIGPRPQKSPGSTLQPIAPMPSKTQPVGQQAKVPSGSIEFQVKVPVTNVDDLLGERPVQVSIQFPSIPNTSSLSTFKPGSHSRPSNTTPQNKPTMPTSSSKLSTNSGLPPSHVNAPKSSAVSSSNPSKTDTNASVSSPVSSSVSAKIAESSLGKTPPPTHRVNPSKPPLLMVPTQKPNTSAILADQSPKTWGLSKSTVDTPTKPSKPTSLKPPEKSVAKKQSGKRRGRPPRPVSPSKPLPSWVHKTPNHCKISPVKVRPNEITFKQKFIEEHKNRKKSRLRRMKSCKVVLTRLTDDEIKKWRKKIEVVDLCLENEVKPTISSTTTSCTSTKPSSTSSKPICTSSTLTDFDNTPPCSPHSSVSVKPDPHPSPPATPPNLESGIVIKTDPDSTVVADTNIDIGVPDSQRSCNELTNLLDSLREQDSLLCSQCGKTLKSDKFWANIASSELLCQYCLACAELSPTKEKVGEGCELFFRAADEINNNSDTESETDGRLSRKKILKRVINKTKKRRKDVDKNKVLVLENHNKDKKSRRTFAILSSSSDEGDS